MPIGKEELQKKLAEAEERIQLYYLRNKQTYTLLPDLPDLPSQHVLIEQAQQDYLIERIGLTLYAALCELEDQQHALSITKEMQVPKMP